MGKLYRCSCGTAYTLEEGKKYKCKKCGAIMALAAEPVASTRPATANAPTNTGKVTSRPPGGPSGSPRPSGGTRPGARTPGARPGARGAAPQKQGLSSGAKMGIGIGAGVVLIGLFLIMNGGSSEKAKPTSNTAKTGASEADASAKAAADAAATAAKAVVKAPPKALTKEEVDAMMKTIKTGDETKNGTMLADLFKKMKEENWNVDRTPLYRAMLRINPNDPLVTGALGEFERNKLNFDEMMDRVKRAEAAKDVKALKDVVQWVFESNLYEKVDYILIYKAVLRVDPNDHEARVARGQDPYDGPIQEYKGKKLHADEYDEVRKIEWKLKKGN